MGSRTIRAGIVFALALGATFSQADSPPPDAPEGGSAADGNGFMDAYLRRQYELFDALRSDPSPRVQVLAGRIYFLQGEDDELGGALRPKREDVVARAAQLAPDDAFVQWLAADEGSYYSSQCGPTRWPEAEVARLLRLESDNAGALQYAVALAQAKGDPVGLNAALARFAAARRADDHFKDEIVAWSQFHAAHPESPADDAMWRETPSARSRPLLRALQSAGYRSSNVESSLQKACALDPADDQVWRRLGWCVDAGNLLASRGTSFALRESGLKILAASGATKDDLADLRRQLDWLLENAATPSRNYRLFADAPDDLAADWKDASSEIAATEHRLQRLGKPSTPPAGWVKQREEEDAEASAAAHVWQDYVRALLDDMRNGAEGRARALAIASEARMTSWLGDGEVAAVAAAAKDAQARESLAALAAAKPDDLLVQWIAAAFGGEASAGAAANVQRLDSANAAAWELSLPAADGQAPAILQRMAAATRYDPHFGDVLAPWLAAVRKRPPPAEIAGSAMPSWSENPSVAAKGMAFMLATMSWTGASKSSEVREACGRKALTDDPSRRDACTAIGRLMLNSDAVAATMVGETLLRDSDALGAGDLERTRKIAWWQTAQLEARADLAAVNAYAQNIDAFFSDLFETGREVDALRLAATRAGKTEPPADWKSPAERRAANRK